jgi:glutamyl-Q tRNA(Asp) synthetase
MYVGRFAPSPTGPLHFGSLIAALASWLDARAARGRWLIRIEDLDPPREQPGAAEHILHSLQALGLSWDGEAGYQSTRVERYRAALARLAAHTYPCGCTRSEISDSALAIDGARIYPGTCRHGLAAGKSERAVRLRTDSRPIRFTDRLQGAIEQSIEREVGDFVLYRADGQFAYQLAVVVDDAEQGVTDVVRGADLLDSTARQIYLQRLLDYPTPRYLHVPVAVNRAGEKLSKQTGAAAIDASQPRRLLQEALRFLGQAEADSLDAAVRNWDPSRIPASRTLAYRA